MNIKLSQFITSWPAIALVGWIVFAGPAPVQAEEYYRWVGKDGVVHYGSRPPEGVEAVKIKPYGSGKSTRSSAPKRSTSTEAETTSTKPANNEALLAIRQKQCEEERSRLATLQSSGARIQMQQADGSSRFLSADEVLQEVENSRQFLRQACEGQ